MDRVEPDAFDILEHVAVSVPCGSCGEQYRITLREVQLSQEVLRQGCPVASDRDCPQLIYAGLVSESAVRDLEAAWSRFVSQVRAAGLELSLARPVVMH